MKVATVANNMVDQAGRYNPNQQQQQGHPGMGQREQYADPPPGGNTMKVSGTEKFEGGVNKFAGAVDKGFEIADKIGDAVSVIPGIGSAISGGISTAKSLWNTGKSLVSGIWNVGKGIVNLFKKKK